MFWHSTWHSLWHLFWHSIWHSICDILPLHSQLSQLRSRSAHWDLALAVDVRQCPLSSGARRSGPAVPTEICFWEEEAGGRRRNEEIMIRSRGPKTSQIASKKARPRHIIIWLGVSLVAALVKRFKWLEDLGLWFHHDYAGKSVKKSINEGIFQGKENTVVLPYFYHILPI